MTIHEAVEILSDAKWRGSSDAHETYDHEYALQMAITALKVMGETIWIIPPRGKDERFTE